MAKKAKKKEYSDNPLFSDYVHQKPKTEEIVQEQKKNLLFDMIDSIFVDRFAYKKYTKECIKQNAFMINRIMSIRYPVEAMLLDRQFTSPYAMYYLWNSMLCNGRRKEMWVFTKGSKKAKNETNDDKLFSENDINAYCVYYGIERKMFDDAMRFFRDELVADVNAYIEHEKSSK